MTWKIRIGALALVGIGNLAAASPDGLYFGVGARPASQYVALADAYAAAERGDEDCAEMGERLVTAQHFAAFRHWAVGYLSNKVAMLESLDEIVREAEYLPPVERASPRLFEAEPKHRQSIIETFSSRLLAEARANSERSFGDVVDQVSIWMGNTYLPSYCATNLAETEDAIAKGRE